MRAAIVASAAAVVATSAVYAMRVSPMVVEMLSRGTGATARIEVQNLNKGNLPFETQITRLEFDDKGNQSERPADEDFIVFPPQGMLAPNGRQVLRLQWVGPPDLDISRAYYLSVNQLPTPGDGTGPAQVQLIYHMKALVVVAPPGASPQVAPTSVRQIEYQPPVPKQGDPLPPKVNGLEVTMKNTGKRHLMTTSYRWVVEGKDPAGKPLGVLFTQEDLSKLVGSGYVPGGGGVRVFSFASPVKFGPGPLTMKFAK